MFKREEVLSILEQAKRIDREVSRKYFLIGGLRDKYTLFGAMKHKYALNPPVDRALVESAEERYGFSFPRDYFEFITEVGDGGAGPEYGIDPFAEFISESNTMNGYAEAYRKSLAVPFAPRQMRPDEVEEFAFSRESYEKEPDKYFVYQKENDDYDWDTDGFYILGTYGCQWDFALITAGERRGQVFDTDNEGACAFVANSFEEFYGQWLERLSDTERFRQELIERQELFKNRPSVKY
ncbi:MAG: SMI1/KNR4 family protein [Oscillospiraceae bacterium]|nr:SMI1/KNR4 family protein [Oscillospiraceae bacterium]